MRKRNKLEMDTVTYSFADGTKQVQPINKEAFFSDNKGKIRSSNEMFELFKQTGLDRGAVSFTIDADTEEQIINNSVEQHYTFKERYNAKRDYKEFKKNNPEQFHKERVKLINQLSDGLSKRLKFNLTNLSYLN